MNSAVMLFPPFRVLCVFQLTTTEKILSTFSLRTRFITGICAVTILTFCLLAHFYGRLVSYDSLEIKSVLDVIKFSSLIVHYDLQLSPKIASRFAPDTQGSDRLPNPYTLVRGCDTLLACYLLILVVHVLAHEW